MRQLRTEERKQRGQHGDHDAAWEAADDLVIRVGRGGSLLGSGRRLFGGGRGRFFVEGRSWDSSAV